ncbi:MAG: Crp/Fnr family transcriptional regulator [Candidatus Sulfotelmatobacter sp.]|jgi:CRP/FNR family transcriptional regulator
MLVARNDPPSNLVRLLPDSGGISAKATQTLRREAWHGVTPEPGHNQVLHIGNPETTDPLYLFACQVEWERRADPSAAWEVISATRSSNQDTRAHARRLLERSQESKPQVPEDSSTQDGDAPSSTKEAGMRTPYGLDVIESCMGCKASREGFFCRFSPALLRSIDGASYHSVMPSGALLFVEGQTPRGVYVLCSGKVKLSTTSKEGKVLILKQAEAGEVLGLSAAISGTNYEMSAETASPCQLDFIGRQDLMTLLQNESELGVHAAQSLSREFQGAYRDIHDLVLARSSSGKLARLLLSCAPQGNLDEQRLRSAMTHEEMAQRIGSSRETVTRLLSHLKKKRLIRLDGATLIIRDRIGLEALAV